MSFSQEQDIYLDKGFYEDALHLIPPELGPVLKELYSKKRGRLGKRLSTSDDIEWMYARISNNPELFGTIKSFYLPRIIEGIWWGRRLKMLNVKPHMTVEVGPGITPFPFALALNGFSGDYLILDLDKELFGLIKWATSNLGLKLHLIQAHAPEIPIRSGKCDLLILNHVLEDIFAFNLCNEYDKGRWEAEIPKGSWINVWIAARDYLRKKGLLEKRDKYGSGGPFKWYEMRTIKHLVPEVSEMFQRQLEITKKTVVESSTLLKVGGRVLLTQYFGGRDSQYGVEWRKEMVKVVDELCANGKFSVSHVSGANERFDPWIILQKCK